jgi:hypothetical protein
LYSDIYGAINEANFSFYLIPDKENKKNSLFLINLSNPYHTSKKLSPGQYDNWSIWNISMTRKYSSVYSQVIIENGCFTIFPFRFNGYINKTGDNVTMTFNLDLINSVIKQKIIEDVKKMKKIQSYKKIYYGTEDITDQIKGIR